MELEAFYRIFIKGGKPGGITGYRNELIKKLDTDPTDVITRQELEDTVTVYRGIIVMRRQGG